METSSRNLLKANEVCVNLELFKRFRFYQLFDPNGPKMFGQTLYRLFFIIITITTQCMIFFANSDVFFLMENTDTLIIIDLLLGLITLIEVYLSWFKSSIFLIYADKIWDVFNISRIKFLKSDQCFKHNKILYKCRDKIIKITNLYAILLGILYFQWLCNPLISNYLFRTSENEKVRKQTIYNFWFPVSTRTFNKYFILFYLVEMCISISTVYMFFMVDVFIISICWVISAQYNVLEQAYKNIITKDNYPQIETSCGRLKKIEDFKSIIFDQIQLNKEVKLFYSVLRPITLTFAVFNTSFIIFASYSLIMFCTWKNIFWILKISSSIVFLSIDLFIYCYFLDKINTMKESVNFGIYSCNWTNMNIQFKKLLLLATRMNSANRMIIKASPKKIINLELFANVMTLSFNMISVLLKTTNKQNEESK